MNMDNNKLHSYTKCPLCGEEVSTQDKNCGFCEKNLIRAYENNEEYGVIKKHNTNYEDLEPLLDLGLGVLSGLIEIIDGDI